MRDDTALFTEGLFSPDGMIHTAPLTGSLSAPLKGRRNVINAVSFADAAVCLNCPAVLCEGERSCFKARKNAIQQRAALSLPEIEFDSECFGLVSWLDDQPGPIYAAVNFGCY